VNDILQRPSPITVVVATNNAHKVAEIQAALAIAGMRFIPVSEVRGDWKSPIEDADTFEGNASIKARAVHAATGLPALADDSGLEVDALGGAPGVTSSSYGGIEGDDALNNSRLLDELRDIDDKHRTARFVSTLVLVGLDEFVEGMPAVVTVTGCVEGTIGRSPRGAHGFGYDPLFLPSATPGKTMAELTLSEKNEISHRGQALERLRVRLEV